MNAAAPTGAPPQRDRVDTEVLIVGAGPVGLLLAGELRLAGVDVLVWERLNRPTNQSRATMLDARTMELFDQRGLLRALGRPPHTGVGHFGGLTLELSLPVPYAGQWQVPQTRTEDLLQTWSCGLGAKVMRGHELCGLTVGSDRVEAEAVGPDGTVRLRAGYLVGCDGEQSTVRQLAGFGFAGPVATKELLRADVTGIAVAERRLQRYDGGLATAATRPDGSTRLMVHEFAGRTDERRGDPQFTEVAGAWARVTGEDIGGATPVWVNAFDNARRQVTRYRNGRVLLAGDAAHVQMPIGGQGLNLGLQDAVNLGWKLAAQVRGWAPEGLLDSYHDERHPVGARVLNNIEAQALLLLGGAEVDALRTVFGELLEIGQVSSHLAGMVSGLGVRYPMGSGEHELLGARMPRLLLETDSGSTTSTALLRPARGVLLDLSAAGRNVELAAAVAGYPDRVHLVRARPITSPPQDTDGLLMRPDGHVAWAGTGTGGLDAALHRWFGRPFVSGPSQRP